jgi:mRNA-degrading endonuclease RelE of RelBE toxin-antitoxin system
VKALKGEEWRGVFRRRIGDYRLLFTVDRSRETFVLHQISLRSGKTYRSGGRAGAPRTGAGGSNVVGK